MHAETAGCSYLLSASRDQTVKLWDIETGFCDHTVSDHTDWVRCLAVRQHDGGLWASSGNDQVIHVYDTDRKKVAELRGHEHVVESLAFISAEANPKSKPKPTKHLELVWNYLASGSRDRTVRLWNISSVQCLAKFTHHENWVRSVLIHPSGNYIISAGDDRTIRVFDIKVWFCFYFLDECSFPLSSVLKSFSLFCYAGKSLPPHLGRSSFSFCDFHCNAPHIANTGIWQCGSNCKVLAFGLRL